MRSTKEDFLEIPEQLATLQEGTMSVCNATGQVESEKYFRAVSFSN